MFTPLAALAALLAALSPARPLKPLPAKLKPFTAPQAGIIIETVDTIESALLAHHVESNGAKPVCAVSV